MMMRVGEEEWGGSTVVASFDPNASASTWRKRMLSSAAARPVSIARTITDPVSNARCRLRVIPAGIPLVV